MASVNAERSFLQTLGGGCRAPIASWGRVVSDELHLDGLVGSTDGTHMIRDSVVGSPDESEEAGKRLASQLTNQGAQSLLVPS